MSLSGPGLAVPASPRVPEQFPPSAFTLTTLLELCYYRSVGKRFESLLCVCVTIFVEIEGREEGRRAQLLRHRIFRRLN